MNHKTEKDSLDLLRKELNLITFEEFAKRNKYAKMTEVEKREYAKDADAIFRNRVFRDMIVDLVFNQIDFSARMSENWEQNLMARGGINGVNLADEWIKYLEEQYIAFTQKPAEANAAEKHELIGQP